MEYKKNNKSQKAKKGPTSNNIEFKRTNSSLNTSKNLWGIIIILTATFICYLPVFHNGFVWDDTPYIYDNPLIRSINIKAIFSEFVMGNYHPFVILIDAFLYKFFGLAPDPYHAFNLILHLLNTFLVFIVFFNLAKSFEIAFIVSLFFGIHPLHVESVVWASELKDLLYTFFFLLALWQYVRYVKSNFKQKYYFLTLLFFVCSLMSKAMGVSLAVVILLVDFFMHRQFDKKTWIEKIPFFVIGIIFGYVAIIAQKDLGAINETSIFNFVERITFACYGFITYIQRIFLPINLTAFYPYPIKTATGIPGYFYIYPFLVLILLGLTFKSLKFSSKIFFGIGLFDATVFLVLQLLPIGGAITADRYSYIPSLGIFYLIALALLYLSKKLSGRAIPLAILICVSLCYGVATSRQVPVWKNEMTLWTDVINKSKYVSVSYYNRGNEKKRLEDYHGAVEDYSKAIEFDPQLLKGYINRGASKAAFNDYTGAIADYTKAIELDPKAAEVYYNRGIAKAGMNDHSSAILDYTKAIELDPKYVDAYYNRGNSMGRLNNYTQAIQDFTKVIEFDPTKVLAYNNRGNAMGLLKDYAGAINDYSKAIDLDPKNSAAYSNRGLVKVLYISDKDGGCKDLNIASELGSNSAKSLLKQYCNK